MRDHAAGARRLRPARPCQRRPPDPELLTTLGGGIKGVKIGVIHHFHETDHKVSDGTQRGITAALETFRGLGAEIREVQLAPLQVGTPAAR